MYVHIHSGILPLSTMTPFILDTTTSPGTSITTFLGSSTTSGEMQVRDRTILYALGMDSDTTQPWSSPRGISGRLLGRPPAVGKIVRCLCLEDEFIIINY